MAFVIVPKNRGVQYLFFEEKDFPISPCEREEYSPLLEMPFDDVERLVIWGKELDYIAKKYENIPLPRNRDNTRGVYFGDMAKFILGGLLTF